MGEGSGGKGGGKLGGGRGREEGEKGREVGVRGEGSGECLPPVHPLWFSRIDTFLRETTQ